MSVGDLGFNLQHVSIDSDNGLAPNRRQAFIWSNDDTVRGRMYTPPGLNEMIWSFQEDHLVHSVTADDLLEYRDL